MEDEKLYVETNVKVSSYILITIGFCLGAFIALI